MASGSHMHNFTTLIKRLEAATSRLEDMAMSYDDSSAPKSLTGSPSSIPAIPPPPKPSPPPPAAPVAAPVPPQIQDFDALIKGDVQNFVNLGEKIGGLVAEQSKAVLQAFQAERTYLFVVTKAKKPDTQPPELMTDLHKASDSINNIRESNRASPLFNHLSAVAEGIVALAWFFESKPAEFVTDMIGGIEYYGNKVLKEYKDKDKAHVEYIKAYYQNFKALAVYLKKHFPQGLTWNNESGIDALEALKQAKGGPAPVSGAPAADMGAVFNQLNQGEGITSTLRKVDKSEMTHKNPNLRAGSIVPESEGHPRKELEGSKWLIENFDAPGEIIEIPAQQNQSILISRCNKTIIKVTNKANAIAIDNCVGLSLIVDSLVSSLDIIKCPKFAVQIDGTVPTLLLDQVDGATVYLGQQSLNAEIFTSKCSAININLPPPEGTDEDTKECPLPEQFKSYIKNGVLVSEIVEHAG
ncbi:hypothetical protein N7449_012027 [Penicillium cf. viridicatum]|uniref:Adenylyl cyclase-associated protein n=1 Tax=Penicillium cf. viridicatum TaxID=2972119 RepID=A0A9W9INN4_9EURO|nr:hypothetical protein N7449_012027 [Penicillium cf. viridicatum]